MKLYFHPVSSNCQKVLMAFYEKDVSFERVIVDMFDRAANTAYRRHINPIGKIPCLVTDEGQVIPESSIIIEYVDRRFGGVKLIPEDPEVALRTRYWDRFIDFYVNDAFSKVLQDRLRPEDAKDAFGVLVARKRLRRAYAILEKHLAGLEWLNGVGFSLADCAAAPSLHIGQKALPTAEFPALEAYYRRATERSACKRIWAENEPWRARIAANMESMRVAQGWDAKSLVEPD